MGEKIASGGGGGLKRGEARAGAEKQTYFGKYFHFKGWGMFSFVVGDWLVGKIGWRLALKIRVLA